MSAIPSTVITLYADLLQKMEASERIPASISRRKGRGGPHLYAVEKHGGTRVQRYLGPEHRQDAAEEAEALRRESAQAEIRRDQVTMLRRAGLPAPTIEVGRVLEAVSRAGLFDTGLVLVGTIAFALYPAIVGKHLTGPAMATQDADFAVASIADIRGDADLTTVLRRADPSFGPAMSLDRKALPKKFKASSGFEVEILTPVRTRSDAGTVRVESIGAGATPLHFLEFLIADAFHAVALYGAGVMVTIPAPARYAVHKLIIAQERVVNAVKRRKDLDQARLLMQSFVGSEHQLDFESALKEARGRGPKWQGNIEKSLAMISEISGAS